ncbi:hypothetical protein [Pollutimonas harenae]|uniref:Uncharacterized protein n=1 Tax=Pollutimonas harenae TaxID=657015 RepID=A0A853GRQ1_9BURK|nr:hypothetical protein [Pollutimonas harenae]NYT84837.1 hypothetical protein [Pollutimonas harenae]TEA72765.1 hypothetical protein ERD84_02320 [Pollutimonas harenae]
MAEEQSSFLRRTTRRALAASGITAAILYGWWQAIEGARTAPSLPEVQPGSSLALGRVLLTPLSIELRPAAPHSKNAQTQLVLSAIVENVTSETQAAAFGYPPRLVTVEADQLEFGAPDITLLRDRQPLLQLQPRMPEKVEIAWQAPAGWQTGEKLSLTFFRQQFKLKDNLYARSSWLGYSPVARMAATPKAAP